VWPPFRPLGRLRTAVGCRSRELEQARKDSVAQIGDDSIRGDIVSDLGRGLPLADGAATTVVAPLGRSTTNGSSRSTDIYDGSRALPSGRPRASSSAAPRPRRARGPACATCAAASGRASTGLPTNPGDSHRWCSRSTTRAASPVKAPMVRRLASAARPSRRPRGAGSGRLATPLGRKPAVPQPERSSCDEDDYVVRPAAAAKLGARSRRRGDSTPRLLPARNTARAGIETAI